MPSIRRPQLALVALVALVVMAAGAGCARRTGEPAPMDPPTFVEVDNQAYLDATIYALRSTQRIRLGHAPGGRRSLFRLPRDIIFGVTALRFQVDFVGSSRAPRSEEISVTPGDTVALLIPPN